MQGNYLEPQKIKDWQAELLFWAGVYFLGGLLS